MAAGDAVGEVESTKSVSDLYAPVTGTVTARNDALGATPEVVNADAYGEGWMVEVELADPAQLEHPAGLRRVRRARRVRLITRVDRPRGLSP